MKIGILSDTHGNVLRTIRAARLLRDHGIAAVLHCGDIGSQRVLIELAEAFPPESKIPVHAVLGNVDGDDLIGAGVHLHGRLADLELDGKRIVIIHGDDASRLRQTLAAQRHDYIFTGHTHQRADHREGRTRLINPGAVHRAATPGCAVLNTATGSLEYLDL